jgi:hypothetical protein
MQAYAPNGAKIVGTIDRITAVANIAEGTWTEDEPDCDFEYTGDTDVDWDSQETLTRNGRRLFLDENGE